MKPPGLQGLPVEVGREVAVGLVVAVGFVVAVGAVAAGFSGVSVKVFSTGEEDTETFSLAVTKPDFESST
jgi:hypothetical protein